MIYPILLKPSPDFFAKNSLYTSTFCEWQNGEQLFTLFSEESVKTGSFVHVSSCL
jgi:hypothetical protein